MSGAAPSGSAAVSQTIIVVIDVKILQVAFITVLLRDSPIVAANSTRCSLLRVDALRFAADHVDGVVGYRDDIEPAVRSLFHVGGGAESRADLERLALGALE